MYIKCPYRTTLGESHTRVRPIDTQAGFIYRSTLQNLLWTEFLGIHTLFKGQGFLLWAAARSWISHILMGNMESRVESKKLLRLLHTLHNLRPYWFLTQEKCNLPFRGELKRRRKREAQIRERPPSLLTQPDLKIRLEFSSMPPSNPLSSFCHYQGRSPELWQVKIIYLPWKFSKHSK